MITVMTSKLTTTIRHLADTKSGFVAALAQVIGLVPALLFVGIVWLLGKEVTPILWISAYALGSLGAHLLLAQLAKDPEA